MTVNIFEHFLRLKGAEDAGATGEIHQLDVRRDQVEAVHGLVFDVDSKHFAETFRPRMVEFIRVVLPDAEIRQTGTSNYHVILHLAEPRTLKQAQQVHKLVANMLLSDPDANMLMKARVVGSMKQKDSGETFEVALVREGRAIDPQALVNELAQHNGDAYVWERHQFRAIVEQLRTESGQPLLAGEGADRGICPIHGSGANPTQCRYDFERASCTCYADCAEGGDGWRWTLRDVLVHRVLSEEARERLGGRDGRPRVVLGNRPQSDTNRALIRAAAQTGRLYAYQGAIHLEHEHRLHPIKSTSFSQVLGDLIEIVRPTSGGYQYTTPAKDEGIHLATNPELLGMLPQVDRVADTPLYDEDWRLIHQRGYHPDSRIYYSGEPIEPSDSTEHLDRLLDIFPWARPCDRSTAMGMLIERPLGTRFDGKRPGLITRANQHGAGKSTYGRCAAEVADGDRWTDLTFIDREYELENRLATAVHAGANTIIIDNVRPSRGQAIESASLERTLTSPRYNFRKLGGNTSISGPNGLMLLFTLNEGQFGPDLLSRLLTIRLHYEGDPQQRPLPEDVGEPHDFARRHRREIVGELLGMIERWLAAGRQTVPVSHTRFPEWAATINGILRVNGIHDFMAGHQEDQATFREHDEELAELAVRYAGESRTASEWLGAAGEAAVWADLADGASPRAQATRVGQRLSQAVGRTVTVPNPDSDTAEWYILRKFRDTHTKANKYAFIKIPAKDEQTSAGPAGSRGTSDSKRSRNVNDSSKESNGNLRDLRYLGAPPPSATPDPSTAATASLTAEDPSKGPARPADRGKGNNENGLGCGTEVPHGPASGEKVPQDPPPSRATTDPPPPPEAPATDPLTELHDHLAARQRRRREAEGGEG